MQLKSALLVSPTLNGSAARRQLATLIAPHLDIVLTEILAELEKRQLIELVVPARYAERINGDVERKLRSLPRDVESARLILGAAEIGRVIAKHGMVGGPKHLWHEYLTPARFFFRASPRLLTVTGLNYFSTRQLIEELGAKTVAVMAPVEREKPARSAKVPPILEAVLDDAYARNGAAGAAEFVLRYMELVGKSAVGHTNPKKQVSGS